MAILEFDSPIKRFVNDAIPIIFAWVRTGVTPTVTVAFDNTTFVPVTGSVEELSPNKFRLNYHANDRPSTPALITYRISEGGDVGEFEVYIVAQQTPPAPAPPTPFPGIGPKRVRTRDLDIEQFDPDKLDLIERRRTSKIPTFCDSHICIGVPICGTSLRKPY
jgi:hypothetical protein